MLPAVNILVLPKSANRSFSNSHDPNSLRLERSQMKAENESAESPPAKLGMDLTRLSNEPTVELDA